VSKTIPVPDKLHRPTHVAIIMDGNGRWAKERGHCRLAGHQKGADVVRDITTFARELEIPYLTLFSFSVQNWRRPTDEVAGLMVLLEDYCRRDRDTLMQNDIRLATIGELSRLPERTRAAVANLVEETADNRAMTLTLAIDYGGREEIVDAVRRLAIDVKAKRLSPDKIDETAIETRLHTALYPDPDLVIRTSGEKRLSNFLLWQLAYAELHFTPVRWPDFGRADFAEALFEFAARERRFGGTSEQLQADAAANEDFVLGDLPDTDALAVGKGSGPC
jgi:undecaprenyl diphosphate synthase